MHSVDFFRTLQLKHDNAKKKHWMKKYFILLLLFFIASQNGHLQVAELLIGSNGMFKPVFLIFIFYSYCFITL